MLDCVLLSLAHHRHSWQGAVDTSPSYNPAIHGKYIDSTYIDIV